MTVGVKIHRSLCSNSTSHNFSDDELYLCGQNDEIVRYYGYGIIENCVRVLY